MKKRGLTTFLALIPFAIASCFAISSCHGTQFVHPYDITELGVTNRTYIKQTSTTKYDYATLLHGTKKYHSGNYLLITAISAPDSTGNCKFNNFLFSAGPSPFTNDSNPQFSNSVGVGIVDFYTRLDNDPNDSGLTNLGIALYYEFDRIVDDYKIKDGTAATPFAKWTDADYDINHKHKSGTYVRNDDDAKNYRAVSSEIGDVLRPIISNNPSFVLIQYVDGKMITNSISTTPPDKGDTLADTVCQTYKDNHPKK